MAAEELERRVERLLAAPSLLVRRDCKGRVDDDLRRAMPAQVVARPCELPVAMLVKGGAGRTTGFATRSRGVRPRKLLAALGPGVELARARRSHQWIERDGARWELPAVDAGARGRAS